MAITEKMIKDRQKRSNIRAKTQLKFDQDDGRTEQCHKDECSIVNILAKYDRTGLLNHVNELKAQYGDYTVVHEYRQALDLVNHANESFNALPSPIRKRFKNDPDAFIEYATNPDNLEDMIENGLAIQPIIKDEPIIETPAPEIAS